MDSAWLRTMVRAAMVAGLLAGFGCDDSPKSRTPTPGGGDEGMCEPACSAGTTCCGARCVVTNTDPNNCGGCGMACMPGQSCTAGACTGTPMTGSDGGAPPVGGGSCTPTCSSAQRCCGGSCVDRSAPAGMLDGRSSSSFSHCNGCGIACDAERASLCGTPLGMSGPPQCLCGNFAQCPAGQACAMEGTSFICVDLNNNPQNCGALGNVCGDGETCTAGVCGCGGAGPCGAGQACCESACVDIMNSADHCGGCGLLCTPNAPTCNGGTCGCGSGPACAAPSAGGLGGLGGMPNLGEACDVATATCTTNTNESCNGIDCTTTDQVCRVGGSGIDLGAIAGGGGGLPIPGGGGGDMEEAATVCCGEEPDLVGDLIGGFLGMGACSGGGGFGGLPFPIPMP